MAVLEEGETDCTDAWILPQHRQQLYGIRTHLSCFFKVATFYRKRKSR